MLSADQATVDAITSSERTVIPSVEVDWQYDGFTGSMDDVSPMVGNVRVERAITSDLPKEVRLIEGNAVASATVELTGSALHSPAGRVGHVTPTVLTANSGSITFRLDPTVHRVRNGDYMVAAVALRTTENKMVMPSCFYDNIAWDLLADVQDASVRLLVYGRFVNESPGVEKAPEIAYFDIDYGGDVLPDYTAALMIFGNPQLGEPGIVGAPYAVAGPTDNVTSPVSPPIAVNDGRAHLVSVYARAGTTTSSYIAPPAGDTALLSALRSAAATNVVVMGASIASADVGPGAYTKAPTQDSASADGAIAVIALPVALAGDESTHAAWYFSPANNQSPVGHIPELGVPVTVDAAVQTADGPKSLRRFAGQMRSIVAKSGTRTAQITALDQRETMRQRVMFPPILGAQYGLNATHLVSQALYSNGYSPGLRPAYVENDGYGELYTSSDTWYPFHGSLAPMNNQSSWFDPQVGMSNDITYYENRGAGEVATRPTFVPGPYVLGAYAWNRSPSQYGYVTGQVGWPQSGNGSFVGTEWGGPGITEFFIRMDPYNQSGNGVPDPRSYLAYVYTPTDEGTHSIRAGVYNDRTLRLRIVTNPGGGVPVNLVGPTVPNDGQWHYVGFQVFYWYPTGQQKVIFRMDDTIQTVNFTFDTVANDYGWPERFRFYLPVAEFHMRDANYTDEDTRWLKDVTVVDCSVDRSTIDLDAPPDDATYEAWELISQLADAEQAIARFDESGRFGYRTRDRLITDQYLNSQVTLTTVDKISEIQVEKIVDSVRNLVKVPYQSVAFEDKVFYSHDGDVFCPANTIFDVYVEISDVVATYFSDLTNETTKPDNADYGWAIAYTGPNATGSVATNWAADVDVRPDRRGIATITYWNFNNFPIYANAVRAWGKCITRGPSQEYVASDYVSMLAHRAQEISVGSSQWVHSEEQAKLLADLVLADLKDPQYVITDLQVVADPRLQLGDRVTIQDRDGLALAGDWWVSGIQEEIGTDGNYVMTINARRALDVLTWDSNSSRWDEAMWG